MFRIKICGITTAEDGALAAGAGADAIGLNFYAHSPRFVDQQRGRSIVNGLPPNVAKVGVFVNAPAAEIRALAGSLALDFVQLHGDEPPEAMAELGGLSVIRAFRLGADGWQRWFAYLERCRQLNALPCAVLVDAHRHGEYGGTGQSPDWTIVSRFHDANIRLPLILAGGLTPGNVAEAITAARPYGVDTASGVEVRPGVKDKGRVEAFVAAARSALRQLASEPDVPRSS
ncbi:MAG TPA: phosphoribosylanthranilate isomerase [Pirellulales bacterium]|nr:phosphoribosylanthranilate isomerase [Pirellulales bacterium]